MARTRALKLREMRLYHLSHGGHAKNPEMVVPNHMYIYGGDIFLLYGTFSDGMFSAMGCLVTFSAMGCLVMGCLVMGCLR